MYRESYFKAVFQIWGFIIFGIVRIDSHLLVPVISTTK
ncbi:Uncharacterised protein [Staphylococcus delphini]|nr:Uncharacterised protein [Staphylococcus delphini]